MVKTSLSKIVLILTVVIAIGSIATITTFLIQLGFIDIGLAEKPAFVPVVAEIPFVSNIDNSTDEIIEEPLGFKSSDQDLISAFLDSLGLRVTETFSVDASVRLFDANQKVTVETSTLKVQPLDPRTVITAPTSDISQGRFFINTDFSKQVNDAGTKYHQFTGWDIVNEPKECTGANTEFPTGCPLPNIVITTTSSCSAFENQKVCVLVQGARSCSENCGSTGSILHGLSKEIDISDWTRQGELIAKVDYSCNPLQQRSSQYWAVVKGEFSKRYSLPCVTNGVFKQDISELVGDSNKITFQFGAQATNTHKYTISALFNDPQVIGNSVIKRQAIELIKQLSIVTNDQEQRILDLGFIETSLTGQTIFDNEKVSLQGKMEVRIDDKTITEHAVTGNGVTVDKKIPLRIDGQDKFIFSLDKQNFQTDSFHTFKLMLNHFVVNVGEGDKLRTFEYHTPFLAYLLEFNVKSGEILAYGVNDKAVSVPKSDSTLVTCGLSSGEDSIKEPLVLPPVVNIIQNGFTIATTNPQAGLSKPDLAKNAEFCSIIPNLPRDTNLTFKIGNNFYEKFSPASQTNFFVKCTRTGCSSNIGYTSVNG